MRSINDNARIAHRDVSVPGKDVVCCHDVAGIQLLAGNHTATYAGSDTGRMYPAYGIDRNDFEATGRQW